MKTTVLSLSQTVILRFANSSGVAWSLAILINFSSSLGPGCQVLSRYGVPPKLMLMHWGRGWSIAYLKYLLIWKLFYPLFNEYYHGTSLHLVWEFFHSLVFTIYSANIMSKYQQKDTW